MPLFPEYAVIADLAGYLAVDVAKLSPNASRLLKRANELIKQATKNNIDATNNDHMEAAKLAACAQVEYWLAMGEDISLTDDIQSTSVEGFSVQFVTGKHALAARARDYLNTCGLLYRGGVKTYASAGLYDESDLHN